MLGILTCIGFTSCGDDDENDSSSNGNAALKVDGKSFGLSHGYWFYDEDEYVEAGQRYHHLEFYAFDVTKGMSAFKFPIVLIDINATDYPSANDAVPVGSFPADKYHVYVVLNENEDAQYESDMHNSSNGNLVITKENGGYKVSIEKVYLEDENGGPDKSASFSFSGKFSQLPDNFHDDE